MVFLLILWRISIGFMENFSWFYGEFLLIYGKILLISWQISIDFMEKFLWILWKISIDFNFY